ncbi:hypothetical protein F4561_003623 [Lipingzhangella halophila]|uniref:Uncharacterized protein n=1 Tax=Lipingzhangella halophila TaxID=1783352 RepID=A0A7W7W3R6_9ACTN|nr:hypothetical protein [Lipingzhangella halophila]MBB4932803.1 hypothetical protein [Lipingzhangella halophila]
MITTALAFGRADLANIRRDPMLRFVPVIPVAFTALIAGGLPELTETLHRRFAVDLAPTSRSSSPSCSSSAPP